MKTMLFSQQWDDKSANAGIYCGAIRFYQPDESWGWLANFSKHPIALDYRHWRTVEHYFQAQKFAGTELELEIWKAESPSAAKALAKFWGKYKRLDWEAVRLSIMYQAVQAKFSQHKDLQSLLLSTGETKVVEDSEDDTFWGQCRRGHGLNVMGEILMAVRAELRLNLKHNNLDQPNDINW